MKVGAMSLKSTRVIDFSKIVNIKLINYAFMFSFSPNSSCTSDFAMEEDDNFF